MPYPPNTPKRQRLGPGRCEDCDRLVIWHLTATRTPIAIDPEPDPTGNQATRIDSSGIHWTRQLTKARPAVEQREVLRRPHFANCPAAKARAARARSRRALARRVTGRTTTGVRPAPWQYR